MLPCVSMAQVRIVKGIVFGPNDTPFEGVVVCAVGSTESTTTDKGGNFELSVSPYATFVEAKMEGFITSRTEIDGSFLMIRLKQDKRYWEEKAKAEAARLKAEEEARIAEQKRIEAERLAAEKAEAARLKAEEEARIAEQKRIEAERLAAEKAEAARLKAEEEARIAEQKRIEAERLAAEKAEAARLKAEEEARIAEQKRIEAERLAAEKAEAARLKAEEEARIAEQKRIEAERLAAEKAETARLKTETAHLKAEEGARIAEQKRIEAEKKLAEKLERREQWSETQKGYASIVEYESFTGFGEKSIFSNSGVKYIAGYKFNNQYYLGAGLGINLNYDSSATHYSELENLYYLYPSSLSVPIFAYFRGNILNRRCSPFIAVATGVSISPKQTIRFNIGEFKYSTSSPFIIPQLGVNFRTSAKTSIYLAAGLQFRAVPYLVEYTDYNVTLKPTVCYGLTLHLGFMF